MPQYPSFSKLPLGETARELGRAVEMGDVELMTEMDEPLRSCQA
jgi:hypothetical protein